MVNYDVFMGDNWEVLKDGIDFSIEPRKLNVIDSRKDKSVMGFGGSFDEAYDDGKGKLVSLLGRLGGDCIEITGSVPLRNGINYQYCLSASLYVFKK